MVTHSEVLEFAQQIKARRRDISREDMRLLLQAKFIQRQDPLASGAVGAINNPMDWLKGLGLIAVGLAKLLGNEDVEGIKQVIEGVVVIVT